MIAMQRVPSTMDLDVCPYCKDPVTDATGAQVYPHRPDLRDIQMKVCWPCAAWVGCHTKTNEPKGTVAKAGLRSARITAHKHFDELWQSGKMSRSAAYRWLQEKFGTDEIHIGWMTKEQCYETIGYCQRMALEKIDKRVTATLFPNIK